VLGRSPSTECGPGSQHGGSPTKALGDEPSWSPVRRAARHRAPGRIGAAGCELIGLGHQDLDIADTAQGAEVLDRVAPAVVINAAAYTNVDGAEREPLAALRSNVTGPAVLAAETARAPRDSITSARISLRRRARRPYRESEPTARSILTGCRTRCERWVRRLQRATGSCGPRVCSARAAALRGGGLRGRACSDSLCESWTTRVCANLCAGSGAALLELAASDVAFGTYQITTWAPERGMSLRSLAGAPPADRGGRAVGERGLGRGGGAPRFRLGLCRWAAAGYARYGPWTRRSRRTEGLAERIRLTDRLGAADAKPPNVLRPDLDIEHFHDLLDDERERFCASSAISPRTRARPRIRSRAFPIPRRARGIAAQPRNREDQIMGQSVHQTAQPDRDGARTRRDGTSGSAKCRHDIPEQRLERIPWVATCVDCQRMIEER